MKLARRFLLLWIFLLTASVRLIGNTQTPATPYWEEAALGYDAYSILKTGKDHHAQSWPIVAFTSFGDYKPSLYFYATVPSVAAFGLNTFAVRFPAVLSGALLTTALFWIIKRWTNEKTAFLSLPVVIFQPWMWHVGRLGFEVNLAVALCVIGIALGLRSQDVPTTKSKYVFTMLASLSFVGAMYAYHGTRLLAPLFALCVAFSGWKNQKRSFMHSTKTWLSIWIPAGLVAVLLCFPLLISLQSPVIQQRFQETSVFSSTQPYEESAKWRSLNSNILVKIFSHPNVLWLTVLSQNYLSHFDPGWLFLRGDINPRHSSQYLGMLYPWEIVTLLFGMAFAHTILKKKDFLLLIALTLLSPLAATFTTVTPHGLRALTLAPWLAVWSGLGVAQLLAVLPQWFRKIPFLGSEKTWIGIYLAVVGLSFGALAYYMFTQYPPKTALEWQAGYKEVLTQLRKHQQDGESLQVSRAYGRPAMYVWFTEKTDPRLVQAEAESAKKDQGEFLTFQEWSYFDGQWLGGGVTAAPLDLVPAGRTVLETVPIGNGERTWAIYR